MFRSIGIDVGGTKMRGVVWNGRRVIKAWEFKTPANKSAFVEKLQQLAQELSTHAGIQKIGICAAGVIDGTKILYAPNITYLKNFDLGRSLRPYSIALDNDARAFVRAEYLAGAARGAGSVLGFTLGTGIGRAYGKDSSILNLKEFMYPEPWEKEYQSVRRRKSERELIRYLAAKIEPVIREFLPEVVVVSGSAVKHKNAVMGLRNELRRQGIAVMVKGARFKKNAGAIGAAMLAGKTTS